jgi:hypothetical protein
MPTQLETVELLGKLWYIDKRLKQYRNVENPHEFMSFDQMDEVLEDEGSVWDQEDN